MAHVLDLLLLGLRQFAGGPGPPENNLVRFGLPAVLWGVLLVVAWSRQRTQELPREKLLVWGFGLGLARELFMFIQVAERVLGPSQHTESAFHQPIEHSLAMAAILVVAAAFLRFILDDRRLARRYLQAGLGSTVACFILAAWTWPRHLAAYPEIQFHQTWEAWLFHLPLSVLIVAAILLLGRKRGWLRNVVVVALIFFTLGEVLMLSNYATDRAYDYIVCPIGNTFHILAIPLLGYVYLREQSIEKWRAEKALEAYRDHLEDLVRERTAELTTANTRLAAQNAIAATLSRSLDLDPILNTALDRVLVALDMQIGSVFLWDSDEQSLVLQGHRGQAIPDGHDREQCSWRAISIAAVTQMETLVLPRPRGPIESLSTCVLEAGIRTCISTPLASKGQALGALTLGSTREDAIQPSELELLTAIGQQIGMVVENARLYQEAERRAEELTLLHQVNVSLTSTLDAEEIYRQIVKQAARLLDCQVACVLLWDNESRRAQVGSSYGMTESEREILRAWFARSGLLQALVTDHRSVAIGDTRSDPRVPTTWREGLQAKALLCVPIWTTAGPLGFLFLLDRRAPHRWQLQEIELIESFVSRAAAALMNAHLHKQLEWAAALEERQRIAADMHDGLGQTLSLLGLRVDRVIELVDGRVDGGALQELHRIREVIGQASSEVRRSIARLQQAPSPRRSLQDLLSELLGQFSSEDGPRVELAIEVQQPLYLPPGHKEQALPIVQEALLNAQRHSQAEHIVLALSREGHEVTLTVQDDGRGFDPRAPQRDAEGHFGLSIMRARAARIGAGLRIDSAPGQGTRVSLTWMLDADPGEIQRESLPEFSTTRATSPLGAQ
jgi:nitrate/nitrite-specific signal transduction histidine kinase